MVEWSRIGLRFACVVSLAMVPAVLAQSPDPDFSQAKGGVVMIRTRLAGASVLGAGLIAAASEREVYVVTANHLVRHREPASAVELQFSGRPGEWFDAKLLDLRDPDLDLAVVVASIPANVNVGALTGLGAGHASLLARGADVYPMGFAGERPWATPVAADKVDRTSAVRVVFQSQWVRPGSSGGALLDRCGRIVGMVTSTEPPDAEAVRIEAVLEAVKGWSLPAPTTLKLSTSPCGPSPVEPAPPPATTCSVSVKSNPSDADVFLDQEESGTTPVSLTLQAGRRYTLQISSAGYETFERQVDCSTGSVTASLRAKTVSISLAYTGDRFACLLQLKIRIGNKTISPTSNPYTADGVPAGPQSYRISGQVSCPTLGVCTASGQGTIDVTEDATYQLMWVNTSYAKCQVTLVDPER